MILIDHLFDILMHILLLCAFNIYIYHVFQLQFLKFRSKKYPLLPKSLVHILCISDLQGLHILPQTVDWSSFPPQQYLLTLGFKNKEDGKFLEKLSSRKLPTFTGKSPGLIIILQCCYKAGIHHKT